MVVLDIDVTASICGLGPGIVENGPEGRGRNVLGARGVDDMDVEISVDDISKYVVGLVAVGVLSDSVVGGRAIKVRKEEIFMPLAVVEGDGEQCFKPVIETATVANSAFV